MTKYRIIGNMTGNSMDAIDLVMTEFDGDIMTDICSYTRPYDKNMQKKIEDLRISSYNKTKEEIERNPVFKTIHDEYISQIAECINDMCKKNNIDKKQVDAIGFHGKTLDHNPPSKAQAEGTMPYTVQMGSGQMLADMTGIPVVYDFRSDAIFAGFEGAPLIPPHNAHISATEGDGIYYNGGNTSNFAVISGGIAQISADSGPFNEYVDNYIRQHTNKPFDKDGAFGLKGTLNKDLLQYLFNIGRNYYERNLPKSGDPAYYHKDEIFEYIKNKALNFEDIIHTFEYFSAYIAVQALTLIPIEIKLPDTIILFGGGWKNPVVKSSFETLIKGKGDVLPEHKDLFASLVSRFQTTPIIKNSTFGEYMEARLFADMARYKLANKAWEMPEAVKSGQNIVCGIIAYPSATSQIYTDCINRAAKNNLYNNERK